MNKKYICPNCNSNDISKSKKGYWKCFDCDHIFHIDDEPVNSMKIFLSYGHTEKKIVDRIYSALKERKHDVWIDHAEIKEGKEWRAAITNGIKESNGVLACLSKYSVRDPGVCLNEIAIAIGVRGGNIATILLEPEDVVKPPASVCHIQWIDMSEWKVKLLDGEPKFEQWFQSKMQIIYNVIESKESRDFVNQIELIKSKLNAFPDFSKQDELFLYFQRFYPSSVTH